eukprot:223414-Pelagomonas_calceolata.AAC.6
MVVRNFKYRRHCQHSKSLHDGRATCANCPGYAPPHDAHQKKVVCAYMHIDGRGCLQECRGCHCIIRYDSYLVSVYLTPVKRLQHASSATASRLVSVCLGPVDRLQRVMSVACRHAVAGSNKTHCLSCVILSSRSLHAHTHAHCIPPHATSTQGFDLLNDYPPPLGSDVQSIQAPAPQPAPAAAALAAAGDAAAAAPGAAAPPVAAPAGDAATGPVEMRFQEAMSKPLQGPQGPVLFSSAQGAAGTFWGLPIGAPLDSEFFTLLASIAGHAGVSTLPASPECTLQDIDLRALLCRSKDLNYSAPLS